MEANTKNNNNYIPHTNKMVCIVQYRIAFGKEWKRRETWTQMLHNVIEFYFNFTLANTQQTHTNKKRPHTKKRSKRVSTYPFLVHLFFSLIFLPAITSLLKCYQIFPTIFFVLKKLQNECRFQSHTVDKESAVAYVVVVVVVVLFESYQMNAPVYTNFQLQIERL